MPAKLTSRLPLVIADLDDKTLKGMTEFAEGVAEGARERVPVVTGALRDAIHVEVNEDEEEVQIVAGDDTAWYGHIVEHGSARGASPHPFLIPAYEAVRDGLDDHIEEAMDDL